MAALERLMGLGMAPELAKRVGFFVTNGANGPTLQGPGNHQVQASTSATINLASTFDLGDTVVVAGIGVTVQVAPDSGSRFNAKTTAEAFVVSAGTSNVFIRQSPTQWLMLRTTT